MTTTHFMGGALLEFVWQQSHRVRRVCAREGDTLPVDYRLDTAPTGFAAAA
ncbi:MAG: hypothetical protein PVF85_02545 [Anaerolineales bacterium]|jgi:hypothetical protein